VFTQAQFADNVYINKIKESDYFNISISSVTQAIEASGNTICSRNDIIGVINLSVFVYDITSDVSKMTVSASRDGVGSAEVTLVLADKEQSAVLLDSAVKSCLEKIITKSKEISKNNSLVDNILFKGQPSKKVNKININGLNKFLSGFTNTFEFEIGGLPYSFSMSPYKCNYIPYYYAGGFVFKKNDFSLYAKSTSILQSIGFRVGGLIYLPFKNSEYYVGGDIGVANYYALMGISSEKSAIDKSVISTSFSPIASFCIGGVLGAHKNFYLKPEMRIEMNSKSIDSSTIYFSNFNIYLTMGIK